MASDLSSGIFILSGSLKFGCGVKARLLGVTTPKVEDFCPTFTRIHPFFGVFGYASAFGVPRSEVVSRKAAKIANEENFVHNRGFIRD